MSSIVRRPGSKLGKFLPRSADPGGPSNGDMWFRDSLKRFRGQWDGIVKSFSDQYEWDAIVDANPNEGDYALPSAAFAAGAKTVYVRKGTYVETADIVIPEDGALVGETAAGVVIVLSGGFRVEIDGSGGVQETVGTISVTSGTSAVVGVGTTFTNLSANDFIELNGIFHRIDSITDNLNLVLKNDYEGPTISGGSYVAQSMVAGALVKNCILYLAPAEGLYVRAGLHVEVSSVLITQCGATATTPAFRIVDSSQCLVLASVCEFNKFRNCLIDNSTSIQLSHGAFNSSDAKGIEVKGSRSEAIVLDSILVSQNQEEGIYISNAASKINITDSVACNNGLEGIETTSDTGTCIIDSCTIMDNEGPGVDFDGSDNVINDCLIKNNGSFGIQAGSNGVIAGCQVVDNGGNGVNLNGDSKCSVVGNRIHNNTGNGVNADSGSDWNTISGNIISSNTNHGFENAGGDFLTVTANIFKGNTNHGIDVDCNDSVFNSNVCEGNGQDGINVMGDDNVLNGNRCKNNTQSGIEIAAGSDRTIVTSNNVRGNTGTNYVDSGTGTIAANNVTA